VVVIMAQGALLSVVAVVFFGLEAPIESLIAGVAVVALLGGAFSALSYGTALKLKSEDSFAPVINGLLLPVLLLSGILLPMTLAPGWLQTVADVNPLTHVVDGVRAMYIDQLGSSEVLLGTMITLGMLLLGVFYGWWVFRKESAEIPGIRLKYRYRPGPPRPIPLTWWPGASEYSRQGATAPV
jgi:ABC-2 type transport system permease protein